MAQYDLIIKNGTIVDGTGVPRFYGDVGIKDGVISKVGANIRPEDGERVLDAAGLIVAPGVIDTHTHYDTLLHWDPYCRSSGEHGATSVVVTSCGFGFAPCKRNTESQERYMAMMESTEQVPVDTQRAALGWDWETFPEWLEHLKGVDKGVNVISYLPLNPLFNYVMGVDEAKARRASPAEMKRMQELIHEAMDHGAVGFSLSHLGHTGSHTDFDGSPMPCDVHDPEDFYELSKVLRERDEGVIQALVNAGATADNRVVAERLAEVSGRPVLHNVTIPYPDLPEFHRDMLNWVNECDTRGLNIYLQAATTRTWIEFTLEYHDLWQRDRFFSEFVHKDLDGKIALASDPAWVAKAVKAYDPQKMAGSGGLWDKYVVLEALSDEYKEYEGQSVGAIAKALDMHFVECLFDILAKSRIATRFIMVDHDPRPEPYQEILANSRTIPGVSDGGAHMKLFCAGQYPTDALAWLGRDLQMFSLEYLHQKLSYLPARIFGLNRRGALLEGYAADIIVYDLASLGYDRRYKRIHDLPGEGFRCTVPARGYKAIIVNGVVTSENGAFNGATPGTLVGTGSTDRAATS